VGTDAGRGEINAWDERPYPYWRACEKSLIHALCDKGYGTHKGKEKQESSRKKIEKEVGLATLQGRERIHIGGRKEDNSDSSAGGKEEAPT